MSQKSKDKKKHKKVGHRKWGYRGALVPGIHKGDVMSPEKRSQVMAKIKGSNTKIELSLFSLLEEVGIKYEKHIKLIAGRPDVVFPKEKIAVFIDGDFWHGWRFPLWQHKLSDKWREKIADTRKRDQKTFKLLRRNGWHVIRLWEHQVERWPEKCLNKILAALSERA